MLLASNSRGVHLDLPGSTRSGGHAYSMSGQEVTVLVSCAVGLLAALASRATSPGSVRHASWSRATCHLTAEQRSAVPGNRRELLRRDWRSRQLLDRARRRQVGMIGRPSEPVPRPAPVPASSRTPTYRGRQTDAPRFACDPRAASSPRSSPAYRAGSRHTGLRLQMPGHAAGCGI